MDKDDNLGTPSCLLGAIAEFAVTLILINVLIPFNLIKIILMSYFLTKYLKNIEFHVLNQIRIDPGHDKDSLMCCP